MPAHAKPRAALRRWLLPGPIIAVLVLAAFWVWYRPEFRNEIGAVGVMVGFLTAGGLILVRTRSLDRRERIAWRVMAVGAFTAASGILYLAIISELGYEPPAFGAADAFFLGGYALLVAGIYRLARADASGWDWLPTLLDGLVGGIALATLVWVAFFGEVVDALQGAPWWEVMIAVSYPIMDLAAVVGLMILVIRRSHYRLDPRLMFLALAMGFMVLNDWVYLHSGVGRSFQEAEPNFSLLLMAVAAHVLVSAIVDITPRKREFPEEDSPIWALVWPYLLAASLLGAHVGRYRSLNPGPDEQLLLDAVILIGVVIFLRQFVMIHRNRVRVESQRSELVASVSHELRTPLTAVVGYLAVLDDSSDLYTEEARREMVSDASEQARHVSRLVSDLVMLARGGNRTLPLELKTVAVSSITAAAKRNLEPSDTRIEERVETSAYVRVDADRVQQAVSNLLSNAVRYGGDEVLLVVRTEGPDLFLEVHDDGPGVPTRFESLVWRRFERGAHRLDASTPGLGIGLAIVETVAESHAGKATYARSAVLGGACFTIMIPGCVVSESGAGLGSAKDLEYGKSH